MPEGTTIYYSLFRGAGLTAFAEDERFELPEAFTSPVFKTGAINQTLPIFLMQRVIDSNYWRNNPRQFSKLLVSATHPTLHYI